jgi:error-prone DNA polymerase
MTDSTTHQYVELHARSAFSFLEGASTPGELIDSCADADIHAMALLDRNGLYGAPKFYMAGIRKEVTTHVGAEIELDDGSYCPLLVKNRAGYQNLSRLITEIKLRSTKRKGTAGKEKAGNARPSYEDLARFSEGLICLTGDDHGPIAKSLLQGKKAGLDRASKLIDVYGRNNVYGEIQRHYDRSGEARNCAVIEISRKLGLPIVATNGVCYSRPDQREILDAFTCIRNHVRVAAAGKLLARNSERFVKSPGAMATLFSDIPEAIANTVELSSRLEFTMKGLGYEFPHYPVAHGETEDSFLRSRTYEGARTRYTGKNGSPSYSRALRQLEHELRIIEKLRLSGYFLIVWDIINFCRDNGVLVQGRGSAANSAVCYSLGITAVDPIGMDLLFERFLSEQRGEWPDIDLDLPSGDRRERVIQYVYQRYGQLGAAMTANVITYRDRSAVREIGKVLGFEGPLLERISKLTSRWEWRDPKDSSNRYFKEAGLDIEHPKIRKFLELCMAIQDLPRHLGQHSGGMVICKSNLASVVPLEPASMPGRVVVQWDKDDCSDMGIIKVDLLGLGMMAVLEDSIILARDHYGEEVDLAKIPKDDTDIYRSLQKADTVGLFQVESRAQMSCLPKLKPTKFYDIVVQIALIRPGPIVGNMVHPYLRRREGREPLTCMHPALEPVLKRTLGVPLFQEQLLKMAMICAGFSGGEAEELRRAFGYKRPEAKMRDVEVKLRQGMEKNGITGGTQDDIVRSITSFAAYGFPESHAASFALIAYASAYLKMHYPEAFTATILNNQPMGFYSPATLVKDAQRHGVNIRPVDITRSDWPCTLEGHRPNSAVRLGLNYVKGLRSAVGRQIIEQRALMPFGSIDDLRLRVTELNKREMQHLAGIGALNYIGSQDEQPDLDRRGALWEVERASKGIGPLFQQQVSLERERTSTIHIVDQNPAGEPCQTLADILDSLDTEVIPAGPALSSEREQEESWWAEDGVCVQAMGASSSPLKPMSPRERLAADLSGTGLTIGPHAMTYARAEIERLGIVPVAAIPESPSGAEVSVAGLVIVRQRPGSAKGFMFLSLEDETGILNVIITPTAFDQYKLVLVERNFLIIDGKIQKQGSAISLKASHIRELNLVLHSKQELPATRSRDFQ